MAARSEQAGHRAHRRLDRLFRQAGPRRPEPQHHPGPDHGHHRAERVRQVGPAQADDGPPATRQRAGGPVRPRPGHRLGGRDPRAAQADEHAVPELRAVRLAPGRAERRFHAASELADPAARRPPAVARADPDPRPGGQREAAAGRAVRRHEEAREPGARAGREPGGGAVRRADHRPGPDHDREGRRDDPAGQAPVSHHVRHHQPRHGQHQAAGRPGRVPARRQDHLHRDLRRVRRQPRGAGALLRRGGPDLAAGARR